MKRELHIPPKCKSFERSLPQRDESSYEINPHQNKSSQSNLN
jgi:hypothetical protein